MWRRNVLIFHQAALGDFIVTWPLALALGRAFPQSRIIYVTSGQKGALARRVLGAESIDVEGGWHALFSEAPVLPESSGRLLADAHIIVTFVSNGSDLWALNVRRRAEHAAMIPLSTGSGEGPHVSDGLASQLAPWPSLQAAMRQMLLSIARNGTGLTRTPDGSIVIHPGGGNADKCWPLPRFVELIRLHRRQTPASRVRVILGEVELERWPASAIAELRDLADVRQPATLLDLLDQISSAGLFIGNDSGPGHLAGIIGVPTLSLTAAPDPQPWRPLGPRVRLLHAPTLDAISVADVALHLQ